VVFVVPLLFETGFDRIVDRCLVVDCPESLQIDRLMQRDDVRPDAARAALAAQISRSERLARADDVVDNGGSFDATREQVDALHQRYLELAQNCSDHQAHAE
ncbi:MAG: dephospho-CoA kinase, partial [Gammaproteobacteria bacterium]|nr:dephospho-CoA kinase [Gammaproteobacteria bacterium]